MKVPNAAIKTVNRGHNEGVKCCKKDGEQKVQHKCQMLQLRQRVEGTTKLSNAAIKATKRAAMKVARVFSAEAEFLDWELCYQV